MNCQLLRLPSLFALMLLGSGVANAQVVIPRPDNSSRETAPSKGSNLPDACRLMPRSDLEALFPGQPVAADPPTLSPAYKGPQYPKVCMYRVTLPSPTSKMDTTKFMSMNIIAWGGQTDGADGTVTTFANMRSAAEQRAKDPKYTFELLPSPEGEALLQIKPGSYDVTVRKGDLLFIVSLDQYNEQSKTNAIALATQVAKRWKVGAGMIEADTPVATNNAVDIPNDTRQASAASPDQWPDACALLTPDDVRSVFGDMKIDGPQKLRGQIEYESRTNRRVDLPNPIRCEYQANRTDIVEGQRKFVTYNVDLNVTYMATTPEFSRKHYEAARSVGNGKTDVGGLGDQASVSPLNVLYIRKGLLTVTLRVGGGENDKPAYDDAARRLNQVARLVAQKLP